MSLDSALAIGTSGLLNIDWQLAIVSQNVANASTPGYALEISSQQALSAGGVGYGVQTGLTTRVLNTQLQGQVFGQNAMVAGLQTQQAALQGIDALNGAVGQGGDLPGLVAALQNSFSTLSNDPGNQTQQQAVVVAAQSLTRGLNALSQGVGAARQTAQDQMVGEVSSLNAGLSTIGALSSRIVQLKAQGQSTADLENQRDAAIQSVSQLVDMRFLAQPDGDMLAVTGSGLSVPLHGGSSPFSLAGATIGANASHPGSVPGIMLGGADVTAQMAGGQIGANILLRDQTLPTYQAELDEVSHTTATRFAAQGLALFTNPAGVVPGGGGSPAQAGYVGFAGTIQANPAVLANPALVRDGTNAVAGSGTGASAFTPNPAGGPAGFTALISRVLDYAMGTEVQAGVPQPAAAQTGLGPSGALSSPYSGDASLGGLASAFAGAQAQDSAAVTGALTTAQGVQTSLQAKLSAGSGVSIDAEMSTMVTLQNAYGANAKIITAAQAMWADLLQTIN